ncbi:MAG TPA: ATP-binding protein, partial [Pyrinomonadaceae bacterium]|nr:ATP-binding protein [Pyrinomonadaceae bacterium]
LVLLLFSLATYAYLVRAAQQRTDSSLAETANSFISTLTTEANDENVSAVDAAKETAGAFYSTARQVTVYDDKQQVVAASRVPENLSATNQWPPAATLPQLTSLLDAANSAPSYATVASTREGIRALAVPVQIKGRKYKVLMVQSLHDQAAGLELARRAFYLANPLALLLASLGGYFLARKSLAPVVAMGNQCERIGAANLDERLAELDPRNELGRLALSFNDLLSRLQASFEIQRRFMADASHELRTPVAIIRGESEVALFKDMRAAEDYRESLAIVHDEGKRLARIVEDLFTLARADTGQYPLERSNMYLDETIGQCVRSIDSLATQRGLSLNYETSARELFFSGDEALVRRMTMNILDNAIKYTPKGGSVRVNLERNDGACNLAITNTGLGIPAVLQPRIFERFFRADRARSRNTERNGSGAGLGLSIARWIAEMHGGNLVLDHSDQNGTTFVISLPLPKASG